MPMTLDDAQTVVAAMAAGAHRDHFKTHPSFGAEIAQCPHEVCRYALAVLLGDNAPISSLIITEKLLGKVDA